MILIPVPLSAWGFLHFTGGFHMMKRVMTTEELFGRIKTILKAKGKPPDTFGYGRIIKFTVQK